jgi:putative GTP pyrophosphokinase
MDTEMSKTQIDKLGERLRDGKFSEDDLRSLDNYRRTFIGPYEYVFHVIRDRLGYSPAGRPAKSTSSIREKLLRESIRLTQIQDIAGCRVVVRDVSAQDEAVARIVSEFAIVSKVDRRVVPSNGYRAVHLIVEHDDTLIEVQCRTEIQHLWSQLSESLADAIDPSLKYGSGPKQWRELLDASSKLVAGVEKAETRAVASGQVDERAKLQDELKALLRETIHWVSNLRDE